MTNGEARALEQPVQSGSCIACGNRMTGSPESFVVATAEVGVTAPEGYSPQQVEALHPHKGGDKTAPPLVDRIADCLVEDHIALMRENERLRAALAEPVQKPVAWRTFDGEGGYDYWAYEDNENYHEEYVKRNGEKYASWVEPLYTAPPQRKPLTLTDLQEALVYTNLIDRDAIEDPDGYDEGSTLAQIDELHRAIERAHGIGE